jgi:hypothetical protein
LSPQHVAELLGVRRRYVLDLLSDPTFKTEFNAALALKRQAATPEALHRITEIVGSDNEGVALKAACVIVGEDAKGPSINVNVQNNLVAPIRPGYVVRLPADLQVSRNAECPASHTRDEPQILSPASPERETLPAWDAEGPVVAREEG